MEYKFINRHIGVSDEQITKMLQYLGFQDLDSFTDKVIPTNIRLQKKITLPEALSEAKLLDDLEKIASQNKQIKSLIGQGFYNCYTPSVILRNVLENPGWYTAYTPYQAEISQGRLEALFNFQTMIVELTAMDIANSSLLDEGSAAAESMLLMKRKTKKSSSKLLVDENIFATTLSVLETRSRPLNIEIVKSNIKQALNQEEEYFGMIVQQPGQDGSLLDLAGCLELAKSKNILTAVGTDLLALCLLKPPGEMGADICFGSSQRFGVPLGFGGPHAAFFSVKDEYKRQLPGRIIGLSIDKVNNPAYRMALQTREQHIRRDKATSNICTAQALLANMAGFYAAYHGSAGLKAIATRVHLTATKLATALQKAGFTTNENWFDNISITSGNQTQKIHKTAVELGYNLRIIDNQRIGISVDETTTEEDLVNLLKAFNVTIDESQVNSSIPEEFKRKSPPLKSKIFEKYHSETAMIRYLRKLMDKDLGLDTTMIPLGSCTMKLNAATEMIPVSWKGFSAIHPFAPVDQALGYSNLIKKLEQYLCELTGYDAISLQPNSGAQGEFCGLMAIAGYLQSKGEKQRNICLIPVSAHGTNAASTVLAGMKVVPLKCDDNGNISIEDLNQKLTEHSQNLAALMLTYPSTHGVFETAVKEICSLIHQHGGQVYLDGANLNAQIGLCNPAEIGADVSHLNLHKTFCIPHGGGGPGVGPVCVKKHLKDFIPGHLQLANKKGSVTSAAYGSAGILAISYAYIRMLGAEGFKKTTQVAILNANYIAKKLEKYYPILYRGENGLVAHECILDIREFKKNSGVEAEDIAKRLIDYGFHAPTMSFPVPNTLMIEPTESEPLSEIDRFIEAMISIKQEIEEIEQGKMDKKENVLKLAPFTAIEIASEEWKYQFTRRKAAFPIAKLEQSKKFPPVKRIDNVYGDRNLICSYPPIKDYS